MSRDWDAMTDAELKRAAVAAGLWRSAIITSGFLISLGLYLACLSGWLPVWTLNPAIVLFAMALALMVMESKPAKVRRQREMANASLEREGKLNSLAAGVREQLTAKGYSVNRLIGGGEAFVRVVDGQPPRQVYMARVDDRLYVNYDDSPATRVDAEDAVAALGEGTPEELVLAKFASTDEELPAD